MKYGGCKKIVKKNNLFKSPFEIRNKLIYIWLSMELLAPSNNIINPLF